MFCKFEVYLEVPGPEVFFVLFCFCFFFLKLIHNHLCVVLISVMNLPILYVLTADRSYRKLRYTGLYWMCLKLVLKSVELDLGNTLLCSQRRGHRSTSGNCL